MVSSWKQEVLAPTDLIGNSSLREGMESPPSCLLVFCSRKWHESETLLWYVGKDGGNMGIQLGPLTLNYYGVIIMAGALAGSWLVRREADRKGLEGDLIWDALVRLLVGGILGARLWHILTPSASLQAQGVTTSYYLSHPLDAIAIWRGGLGIPGAIAGGVIALYLFSLRRGVSFFAWLDVTAPGLALGQAIGRWGNFVNQELYGAPTDLPWAIYIDPKHRLSSFLQEAYYHPLFLYESLWSLANMGLLLWIGRRFGDRLRKGDVFLIYLLTYFFGRFFLEFLRLDPSPVAGLNVNQSLAAVTVVVAGSILGWRFLRSRAGQATARTAST
jgi:phosphatidylglycerol:prolipoprotein diacylglycerol transferase